jgi:hypothetical protein
MLIVTYPDEKRFESERRTLGIEAPPRKKPTEMLIVACSDEGRFESERTLGIEIPRRNKPTEKLIVACSDEAAYHKPSYLRIVS